MGGLLAGVAVPMIAAAPWLGWVIVGLGALYFFVPGIKRFFSERQDRKRMEECSHLDISEFTDSDGKVCIAVIPSLILTDHFQVQQCTKCGGFVDIRRLSDHMDRTGNEIAEKYGWTWSRGRYR